MTRRRQLTKALWGTGTAFGCLAVLTVFLGNARAVIVCTALCIAFAAIAAILEQSKDH